VDVVGEVINCCDFIAELDTRGWTHASGVPCSTFSGPIAHLTGTGCYEASANEGLALSSAAGAALGGRRQAVFLQNSGLGNLINPLSSLCGPYGIPVLVVMSLRGWPNPAGDEPQHEIMGRASVAILDALGVWHARLDGSPEQFTDALDRAAAVVAGRRSAFLLAPMRSIGEHSSAAADSAGPDRPDSMQIAQAIAGWADPATVVFSSTGFLSRYLFAAADRQRNFYMQGSMGHASALAVGYCRTQPDTDVVVLDGDGAALMHLGQLAVLGSSGCARLIHVIVDNGSYASTGGQDSPSAATDFAAVAAACGYQTSHTVASVDELVLQLHQARGTIGPHCIVVDSSATRSACAPPRASAALSLTDIADRLTGLPSAELRS
jgi:phosphonopyruvate decarboxylase